MVYDCQFILVSENLTKILNNTLLSLKENWEYPVLFFITFIFFHLSNKALFLLDNPYLARNSDAWFNLGFMLSPKELFAIGPNNYQWDRLTWELPGHFLFKFFDPIQAQYILHFSFFIIAIFSFFLINKYLLNKKVALISSILLMSFSPFLIYMGSNYVDAPVITFFLLTLLMIVSISNKNKMFVKLSFAGIFFACMVISQPISFFIYIAALGGIYYFLTKFWDKKQHLFGLFSFFLGIIGTLIFFSVIFYFLTGSFSFLKNTILFLTKYNIGPNPWFQPWYELVGPIHYIILIFFVLSIIWCLIGKNTLRYSKYELAFPLFFIIPCIFFIFMSVKPNPSPMLKELFVCLLIPLVFYSISSFLNKSIKKVGTILFNILIISELLIISLPYVFHTFDIVFLNWLIQICVNNFYFLLISEFLLFLLLILLSHARNFENSKQWDLICFTVMVCIIINFAALNIVSEPALFIDNPKYQFDSFENGFSSVVDANHIIYKQTGFTDRKVVWYNQTETDHNGNYYGGLYETVGYSTLSYRYDFPDYDLNNITNICPASNGQTCENTTLVILSTDPSIFPKIQKNFQEKNQTALLLRNENILSGKVRYNVTIVKIFQENDSLIRYLNNPQMTSY